MPADDFDFTNTAAIVMPALWPSGFVRPNVPDLHMTYYFFPDVTDVSYTKDDVIEAIKEGFYNVYVMADVFEFDLFGPESDVPVLRVRNELLQENYKLIGEALRKRGIDNYSKYYGFKPHVTIDEDYSLEGGFPPHIWLKPVELWWRDVKIPLKDQV